MRSPFYENTLTREGLSFTYLERVNLDDIDTERSLQNQARLETPLDDELIEQYALSFRNREQLPPVVFYRLGKGKYILIDGNQRTHAARKAELTQIDGYLVDCADPKVIDRVTWTFNNKINGKRISKEEALEHALSYVAKYGYDQKSAAREWGVSLSILRMRVAAGKIEEILARHNVPRTNTMTLKIMETLYPLRRAGEDVLVRAAAVVGKVGMNLDETDKLVAAIRTAPTSDEKLRIIDAAGVTEQAKQRQAETGAGRIVPARSDPRLKLVRLVRELEKLVGQHDKAALKPAPSDYKETRKVAYKACNGLAKVFSFGDKFKEETA